MKTRKVKKRSGVLSSFAGHSGLQTLFRRKAPVEVAVSLNLTHPEVTQFYREYWDLMKLHCLNKIYEDLGEDIGAFLKLYALCNSTGFDKKHVNELLRMADDNWKASN